MNTIIVKINDATQTISQVQVITKDGIPTVITATDKVNYEFFDTAINHAPNHIITKRLKNDLYVSFEEAGVESDLIIEGFYDHTDSALLGVAEDGEYYYYIPDTGETYDYVTQLEVGDVEGQALGGEEYIAAAILPWWIPAAAGIGLVGLIAGRNSDDDNDNDNAPIAENDTVLGESSQPVIIDVVANDSDAENDLDPKTVKLIDPITGDAVTSFAVDGEGAWAVDATTGEVSFTPETGFTADPTPVSYVVSDINGLQSNQATITIDYPQNAPVAEDDTALGETGQPVTIDVVANDSDAENDLDPTTVGLIDPVSSDEVTTVTVAGEGTWDVDPTTGEVSFTPESGFTADPTPVSYVVSDINGLQSNQAVITANYPLIVSIAGTESLNETTADGSMSEANYTINLSKPSNEDTVITITIGDGSTEGSEDYTAPVTQYVTIPAGQTSVDITVPINDDNVFEGPEDFTVTITEVISGIATVGLDNNSVTTTIYDDGTTDGSTLVDATDPSVGNDTPTVSISGTRNLSETAVDGSANEAIYTVSLSNPSTEDTVVTIVISDGSTEGSADYTTPVTQDVTIPAGQNSVDIAVPINDDNVFEGPEDFTVTVAAVTSGTATIGTDNVTVNTTIYDDGTTDGSTPIDPNNPILGGDKPVVDITAIKSEAIEGVSNGLVFEVSQNNLSEFPTTVDVKLANSTIEAVDIASINYTDLNGTVVFLDNIADIQAFLDEGVQVNIPVGSITAPVITFTVVDDAVYEQSESIVLEISNPMNATIGTASDSGTIFDQSSNSNNPGDGSDLEGDKPILSVGNTSAIEGGDLIHSISLSNPTQADVIYTFALSGDSAIEGMDFTNTPVFSDGVSYDPVTGTITIPAGVTDFTVSYPTTADSIAESDETTTLTIDGISGTGTIFENNDRPILNINASTAQATEGAAGDIVFTIDQVGLSDTATSVILTLDLQDVDADDIDTIALTNTDGSIQTITVAEAIAGVSVSIPAGTAAEDMPSIAVTPTDDDIFEISEMLEMSISNPVNAIIGTNSDIGVILDEDGIDGTLQVGDKPTVSIAATDGQAIEGLDNTLAFSVTQDNLSNFDTNVTINLSDISSIDATDIASISYTNGTGMAVTLSTTAQIQDFISNGDTVTIPAGSMVAPAIIITVVDDAIYEVSE
ncbi:Calx-beta domain-containing protein, partial [Psychrobacter sp. AOP7-B1-24]|uniref:Calx-beta domain-containing protein n=1 Tax=Psychrobacter sp. AOP7-B1-24 TaxID=3457645 RepID=UPI00402BEF58